MDVYRLPRDKSISPILTSSIELLIVVIQMLLDRQTMNSSIEEINAGEIVLSLEISF
jgi:hypothetical protein